jgi:tetratricopeptide (TPR) repeat protein
LAKRLGLNRFLRVTTTTPRPAPSAAPPPPAARPSPRARARRGGGAPLALLLAAWGAVSLPAAAARPPQDRAQTLAAAQELLDGERPEEAMARVEPLLAKEPDDAAALLVRGTARLMLGEVEAGRRDLDRSLALDPGQRRGWLNLAALAVAEERHADALRAFLEAEKLDPAAPENDLNIGAVLLLQGKLKPASERFAAYLAGGGASADGTYLVATNYALAGYAALAVEHLRRAVELDERARLRARTDPNFAALAGNPAFAEVMATDAYRPPEGAYAASRPFPVRYDRADGRLLGAVIDTLQLAGRSFDPRVEVTDRWALVWGDLRIKVTNTLGDQGLVQVSAPADRLTPAEWRARSEELFAGVEGRLAGRGGAGR